MFVLVGCSNQGKTAKDLGKGISVEVQTNKTIKSIRLEKYVNGSLVIGENATRADNKAFKKGEVLNFDFPMSDNNEEVEFKVLYTKNLDATHRHTTNKVKVKSTKNGINLILNQQNQLEVQQ
jgi:hypothetical protein